MAWNLYEKERFLQPLCFSNGKTQEDVVKEVLKSIEEGKRIIFIKGICGTGKSAIALNVARKLGKASIVVPGKNLQAQYKKDYEGEKYLLKDNGERVKISVITGRRNHKCKFLEDNDSAIPKSLQEVDSNLNDIFEGKRREVDNLIQNDKSANNKNLPCKIELKQNNWQKIKSYVNQNSHNINKSEIHTVQDVKRMTIAGVCPYWSPVFPDKYDLNGKTFEHAKKKTYQGLDGQRFIFYQRKPGCPFYEQFNDYIESDVLVFNSLKYKLETILNRKPKTEVEIIDECDEFLDSFSNQSTINFQRLQNALMNVFAMDEKVESAVQEIIAVLNQIRKNKRINDAIYNEEIIPLKETGIFDLLRLILDNQEIFEYVDDESYLFDLEETARMFESFFNETYVTFNKKDDATFANLVTTALDKKFKELADKNKIIVLMSGTLHSEQVLRDVFGLDEFCIIEAEIEHQGDIEIVKTGLELDCKYSNFSSGKCSRRDYLAALNKAVEMAAKPCLVHVNSFNDLPSNSEKNEQGLDFLPSREELRQNQNEDSTGEMVADFKSGLKDVLFSTRSSRGIDFPGEQCNSIIFTKYPNPDVKDAFWKILHKTKPQYYWEFYKDKAQRELMQKIYRGLRFKGDRVQLLSPDLRVLEAFEKRELSL